MKKITLALLVIGALLILWPKSRKQESSLALENTPTTTANRKPAATTAANRLAVPSMSKSMMASQAEEEKLLIVLQRLGQCYDSRDCGYPETDPKSYEIALGKDIAHVVDQLGEFKNSKYQPQIEKAARDFLRSFDGFVQEAALKIISGLPTSPENLAALTEGLENSSDPSLLEQALPEFKRYLGTPNEGQVHNFLSKTISTGAHFSAQTVSENIFPFITKESYAAYKKAAETMTLGSQALINLSAALKDYRRRQTGA